MGLGWMQQRIRENRFVTADLLAGLTPEQWTTPSLCAGWTVRDVAGHMLIPCVLGPRDLALALARSRGSIDRAMDGLSRRLAARPTDTIVAQLREHADSRVAPPVVGIQGPFTDSCIHLRDIARPLGSDASPPTRDWYGALDFLLSAKARIGFMPRGRTDGLLLQATDGDWVWPGDPGTQAGRTARITGPVEALAMAVAGRSAALPELSGDGVAVLAGRLG